MTGTVNGASRDVAMRVAHEEQIDIAVSKALLK